MNNLAIQTKNLSFSYDKKEVLNNLNLKVPESCIYGFLGPNGSGKTTTIKLLLGLLETPESQIHLFGKSLKGNRIETLQKIGSLVETPSIYGHLTATENLKAANVFYGKSKNRIAEVLDIMGLSSVANKKAKTFSLGMLQRLGIALALLPDPKLLILDEPTNGLDPNGIIDIRNLLTNLYKNYGKTIFISSHMLSEIEKITSHVGIIDQGKLLFQGSMDELNQINKKGVTIKTSDAEMAVLHLKNLQLPVEKIDSKHINLFINEEEPIANAIKILVNHSVEIYSIIPIRKSLEDLFLDITSRIN